MEIKNLTVKFGNLTVIDNQSFVFPDGKITCVMGPSGCGKTTLLNAAAGLYGKPSASRISYIFQEPRLLPWLTVKDNILAAMPDNTDRDGREAVADKMLSAVGLTDFAAFYPAKLSGGMRQRASLARAFARPCDLMLMDEPFNGQDLRAKREMIALFLRLWAESGVTTIAVTHEINEAWLLADEVMIMTDRPASEKLRLPVKMARPLRAEGEDSGEFIKLKHAAQSAILNK